MTDKTDHHEFSPTLLTLPEHLISHVLSFCDAKSLAALETSGRWARRQLPGCLPPCEEAARLACLDACGGDMECAKRFRRGWQCRCGDAVGRTTAAARFYAPLHFCAHHHHRLLLSAGASAGRSACTWSRTAALDSIALSARTAVSASPSVNVRPRKCSGFAAAPPRWGCFSPLPLSYVRRRPRIDLSGS